MESDHRDEPRPTLPQVTVVIPAFNLERYVADAIESALQQDYLGQWSIIVLDDGSSDSTYSLVQQLSGRYSKLSVYTQPNRGRVATRNRLLEMASTELVAWLDGDDIATPSWLSDQVKLLSSDASIAAVSGQGYAMMEDGQAIGPILHPLDHESIVERHLSGKANAFFQSCTLVRKSWIVSVGGYRDKYPAGEDFDLWLRLGSVAKLQNVDRYHLCYRVHPTQANATISVEQRQQGMHSTDEARCAAGLEPLPESFEAIPPRKKDDWNRRVYWINIALKSGNPRTAISLIHTAIGLHPTSLLLALFYLVAIADSILFLGNRTGRFRPGVEPQIRSLPWFSIYRFGRWINAWRRRLSNR